MNQDDQGRAPGAGGQPLRAYWAKSPARGSSRGEALTEHLGATLAAVAVLRDRVGRVAALPGEFWRWAALAALLHDAGKLAAGFQRMVRAGAGGTDARWGERHEVLSLGFVAALLPPGVEREWVGLGVVTHHRPLFAEESARTIFAAYQGKLRLDDFARRFGPVDPEAARALLEWFRGTATAAGLLPESPEEAPEIDSSSIEPAGPACDSSSIEPAAEAHPAPDGPDHAVLSGAHELLGQVRAVWGADARPARDGTGLAAVLLQGAVTLADHVSSAHGELCTDPPLDGRYPRRLAARLRTAGSTLRPHQRAAARTSGDLILRAPTGSGKTEAALLWAARQVSEIAAATGGRPRVFYTLPYLASINAMTLRLAADLGTPDIGVAHSRAGSFHLAQASCPEDGDGAVGAARKAVSRAAATRLFRELVRVGTPYQLLRGALAGPAHAGVLLDAANSVFVLDELHAYDAQRIGMVLATARLWADLGGRVAVLSATLPEPLAALVAEALGAPPRVVTADAASWPVRHRLRCAPDHLTDPASIAAMSTRLERGESLLVVANNVADARTLYAALAPVARRHLGEDAALLLHSRFRRMDREAIEARIRARHATSRTEAGRRPGLLVATQVVEVSLDVDFDALHTSGAPLEALLQRFGRVNRLGARPPADVVVHPPAYGRRRGRPGGAEFADGVYPAEPTRLGLAELARHDGAVLDERDAQGRLDAVYAAEWGVEWAEEVSAARDDFTEAFLAFERPFEDRSHLDERFSELFDGVEAVLDTDLDAYRDALETAREHDAGPAAGRLLAARYLLPLPYHGRFRVRFDRELRVGVVAGDYTPDEGLIALRDRDAAISYALGEVL